MCQGRLATLAGAEPEPFAGELASAKRSSTRTTGRVPWLGRVVWFSARECEEGSRGPRVKLSAPPGTAVDLFFVACAQSAPGTPASPPTRKVSLLRDGRSEPPSGPDLAALFHQHGEGLAGAARGILGPHGEIGEVLQEAFLRAWRFLAERPAPRDPVAWLFVVTMNTARDLRRKRLRQPTNLSLEEVSEMEMRAVEPTAQLEQREALTAARSAIHALSEREREVFLLRTSGGLSFEAAAAALQIPVGTAKSRMRAALGRLRKALAAHAPAIERRQRS